MNYCKQTVFLILLMLVLLLPLAPAEGRTFITVDGYVPLEIREGSAVTAEELMKNRHAAARDVLSLVMAGVVLVNIFYANRLYLKMKLEYENAYAFYSTLVTRIKSTPGYEPGDMVYITGDAHNLLHESDEIDTSDLVGIMEGLINIYSRGDFLTYYAGFDPPAFDWAAWDASGVAAAVADMPEYPYDGSVIKSGNFIIVKLG